jgi:hypothetical protein
MERPRLHLALFLTSLATLVYEIALMRLFSVTLWYYFAFFVISLALLGGGTAAAILYVCRGGFAGRLERYLPAAALLHGLFCALSPAVYLSSRLVIFDSASPDITAGLVITFAQILALFFLPFVLGGTVVAAILSFFPEKIGTLYWADLGGAGIGCLLVIPLLWRVPAPNLLAWVGLLPVVAALLLRKELGRPVFSRSFLAGGTVVLLLAASGLTPWDPYRVRYSKVRPLDKGLVYVRWTPLARLSVYRSVFFRGDQRSPFGWGMSPRFAGGDLEQRWIEQDECAGTPITRFDGDLTSLGFLEYDVTNFAYLYRAFQRVLVVGAGGGRDILAARHFGAEQVTAVEINPGMVDIVDGVFGDFSGRPYNLPGVSPVVSEARSYLARSRASWDLIQISLIDSWAASMAGAFALAENNLYTVEAFETYLDRLADDGVLTVSRWYNPESISETARLANLCAEALQRRGVTDLGRHIVVINGGSIATVLASKRPFGAGELAEIDRVSSDLSFRKVWIPGDGTAGDAVISRILSSPRRADYVASLPLDLSAPTDDRPFFFLHTASILRPPPRDLGGGLRYAYAPVASLMFLFYLLCGTAIAFTILPLMLATRGPSTLVHVLLFRPQTWIYFAGIGAGFMLVELSLLQRYVLFLGHPTYAASVVLFSLLVFAGLGSVATDRLSGLLSVRALTVAAALVIVALIAIQAWAVPRLLSAAMGWTTGARILLAGLLLAPLGCMLGMLFPLGIRRLREHGEERLIPYLWGVNGVFSVLGSVLATIIAVSSGYSAGLGSGLAAYLLAMAMAAIPSSRTTA